MYAHFFGYTIAILDSMIVGQRFQEVMIDFFADRHCAEVYSSGITANQCCSQINENQNVLPFAGMQS
jgi:hypothetical protein